MPLPREEAHHALRARWLEDGAPVEVFDGTGRAAEGSLRVAGSEASVALARVRDVPPPCPWIDAGVALPKGTRIETLIQQLSQLGADRILPVEAARASVRPRPGKRDRLQRVAVEAAKQCGRDRLIEVAEAASLGAVLEAEHDLRLIAAGEGAVPNLPERAAAARRILVLIGPEGGWRADEIEAAEAAGALRWTLGPLTLRIETAAAAAAALLRYWAPGRDASAFRAG